jgi:hypothetical protein
MVALPLIFAMLVPVAWATDVEWDQASLTFQKDDPAQQASIMIKNLPGGTQPSFASFYLVFDKTALELSTPVWNATVFDIPGVPTDFADGWNISAVRIVAAGTVDDSTVIVTIDVKPVAGVTGNYNIGFKVGDPLNVLQDALGGEIGVASWADLPVTITEGPPDPAKVTAVTPAADRQKDPVEVNLAWTDGRADTLNLQYSEDGGGTWNDAAGAVGDIPNKKITWTSGFTGTKSLKVRARAQDQGKVWDGAAIVDADDVGWVEAAGTLVIDHEAPDPQTANGSGDQVTITFQGDELLDNASAETTGNYAVSEVGGAAIGVTGAAFATPNVVTLTLDATLVSGNNYEVAVNNIADALGNAMAGAKTLPISLEPNPARITAVTLAAARQKDPAEINLAWTTGIAQVLELQYSDDGGATWNNTTITPDIPNKKIAWTSGFATKTVTVRARAIDQNKVWDGTAIVDKDDVGWVEAATALTVDNDAPDPQGALGAAGTKVITVTFQAGEILLQTSAEDLANYLLTDQGTLPTAVGDAIPLKSAVRTSASVVDLTLADAAAALAEGQKYRVTVSNIEDTVGNVMAAAADLDFEIPRNPSLIGAEFQTRTSVKATFNNDMNIATLGAADWTLTPGQTVTNVAAVAGDPKSFTLTTSQMAQATDYTLTAPAGAEDTAGRVILPAGRAATFTSKRWHDFAAGTLMMGVPLDDTERLITMLGAAAVAQYDPTIPGYIADTGVGAPGVGAANGGIMHVPGMGYFAKFAAATTAYFDGDPLSGAATVGVDVGWNIISPPRDIKLAKIAPGFGFAWHHDPVLGWQLKANLAGALNDVNDDLLAWSGYFVNVTTAGNIDVGTAGTAAEVEPLDIGGEDAKLIQLVVQGGGAQDSMNLCGIGDKAVEIPNPPAAVGGVDLCFVRDGSDPLAVDVRSGNICQKWDMVVTASIPETSVSITAPDLSSIPADYAVILTDQETGRKSYLRTSGGYSFQAGAVGTRKLSLEIVARSQATLMSSVSVQAADGKSAVITYGLTGPASVTPCSHVEFVQRSRHCRATRSVHSRCSSSQRGRTTSSSGPALLGQPLKGAICPNEKVPVPAVASN